MEDPPLTRLTPSMLHFWSYDYDRHARNEMIKLHPKRDQVVTVTIDDLNIDPPPFFSQTNHDGYLCQLKNTLYKRAQERQEFNFYLSEFRTTRYGGSKVQEMSSSSSSTAAASSSSSTAVAGSSECEFRERDAVSVSVSGESHRGDGMAIAFNWRLSRAVSVRLPRDIAMAARYVPYSTVRVIMCYVNIHFALLILLFLNLFSIRFHINHHFHISLPPHIYFSHIHIFI